MVLPPGGQVAGGTDDGPLPPLGPRAVPDPAHCKGRCCSVLMEPAFTEHGLLALLIVKVGAVQSAWGELSQNMAFLPCSW